MGQAYRIGIDIGGTFTDFVVQHPLHGIEKTYKLLSTPQNPALVVLQGLELISRDFLFQSEGLQVIHGSTVATNALLERKGANCAFIATLGFKDLLQIGRQNRPALYDLFANPPPALVPDHWRFEADERLDHQGNVLRPLDLEQVDELVAQVKETGVESVAICLLFSYLDPGHEAVIADRLRAAGLFTSVSSELLPEFREYERASTTAVNAYVSPILDHYLSHLDSSLPGIDLRIMQSNGGSMGLEAARRFGVHCILSGPAGGVIGAQRVGELNRPAADDTSTADEGIRLITFDMGGTSTDVCLIDGKTRLTSEAVVGGCPIGIPLLDIHTIGAGGGSIARMDAGGALRIGPESAGANPGPACYGHGSLPTVTDANLVLGRLDADLFLGGTMPLYPQRAWSAVEELGRQMNLDPLSTAWGMIEIANAHMERALRLISVERGHDPRRFTLLSFGGAGGLHAADLARSLGIPSLLIPPLASVLSAFGMLAADVIKDYVKTVMLSGDTLYESLADLFLPMETQGHQEIAEDGIEDSAIWLEKSLDMRLRGQSYEINVPFTRDFLAEFHTLHHQNYGYSRPKSPVEIVSMRLRARGVIEPPELPSTPASVPDPTPALIGKRPVVYNQERRPTHLEVPFYRGEQLRNGNRIAGPCIIVRSDTTILLNPGDRGFIDEYSNLQLVIG